MSVNCKNMFAFVQLFYSEFQKTKSLLFSNFVNVEKFFSQFPKKPLLLTTYKWLLKLKFTYFENIFGK